MSTPTRITVTGRQAAVAGAAVVLLAAAGLVGHSIAQSTATPCSLTTVTTATIQAAVKTCANGTITLPAGTFNMTGRDAVNNSVTITGQGPTLTHLIQTVRSNIFQITAPNVTVENLDLNTALHFPGVPPVLKDPVPATLFSNADNTHLINLTSEAGTGFGMRISLQGGVPCESFNGHGTVITNVSSTNTGTGGFTPLDIDCTDGATLTNITIHGAAIAFYEDEDVTLNGGSFHQSVRSQGSCAADWFVTGPSNHITISNFVTYNGKGKSSNTSHGVVTFLVVSNETFAPGDVCTNGL